MYASIDIGTNTVLLLVADVVNGTLTVQHEEQRMPRLGKGVDASGNLHPDSIRRVLNALGEYKRLLEDKYTELLGVTVTATSAVRDAGNREQFIRQVREETGFGIQLLNGYQEAEYTYVGALSMLPGITRAVVIDIGGGSTEIALGGQGNLLDSHSFDMGSVRFTERYLQHDPPLRSERKVCVGAVKEMLRKRPFDFDDNPGNPELVGVAGTVTSLAFMDSGLDIYEAEKVNGYTLPIGKISSWVERLSSIRVEEIEQAYPTVMKGRADIITAGLLILKGFMEFYSMDGLTVSTGGIRHGTVIKKNDR